ncbi:hypothetical protein HJB89_05065 [Rhizobium sp. NZLR8]|uniref:hypothetical protein n=1 Tax=Rhizobium sp. NZLR8 TaxID=2731104 RepID=UPI001C831F9B|nr:hypothetical protein [Rhizobium sp. NZLR8]MBX5156501.1 hypothetical protein [Rhizobium sp. NZLR8]
MCVLGISKFHRADLKFQIARRYDFRSTTYGLMGSDEVLMERNPRPMGEMSPNALTAAGAGEANRIHGKAKRF